MAWPIKTVDEAATLRLVQVLDIKPVLARLLVLRGLVTEAEARRFLSPRLEELHSPALMPDMEKAVARIRKAIEKKEKILVWGHDDLDGATGVALLVESLTELGGRAEYYIPDKTIEPHGLQSMRLDEFGRAGVSLVITTDCGITNFSEVRFALEKGIDIIITDHHELTNSLPEAGAVLNPKRPDSRYPFFDLAGVGVAYKLSTALFGVSGQELFTSFPDHLILAAFGTIADRVGLVDENRIFVSFGLKAFAESSRPAFRVLHEVIGLSPDRLKVERITGEMVPLFSLLPAQEVVRFLLEKDYRSAEETVRRAQSRVSDFKEEGREKFEALERQAYLSENLVVAYDPHIPIRHLGFCATKLRNRFSMPALVLSKRGETWVGELRGFEGQNLLALLKSLDKYLLEYGGHKRACGFSLPEKNFESFLTEALEYARISLPGGDHSPDSHADGILPLSQLTKDFQHLAPFGPGNPKPLLIAPATRLSQLNWGLVVLENPALNIFTETPISNLDEPLDLLYTFDDHLNVYIKEISHSP